MSVDSREYAGYTGSPSFMRCEQTRDLEAVDIAVVSVPFDLATSNRPGARFGPRSIREESLMLSGFPGGIWPWDFDLVEAMKVIDYGDIPYRVGDRTDMIAGVLDHVGGIIDAGASVLALGGDHYISYPLLRAHAARYGPLSVVHFDAHCDSWASGDEHNHGTLFYHAAREKLVDPSRSVQVGLRTHSPETHGYHQLDALWMAGRSADEVAEEILGVVGENPVYLSFDIDFLDPAYAPGTGAAVPGGLSTREARAILGRLGESGDLAVVGADQVEVSPPYDQTGRVTALAGASLAMDMAHLIAKQRMRRKAAAP